MSVKRLQTCGAPGAAETLFLKETPTQADPSPSVWRVSSRLPLAGMLQAGW